MTKSDAKLTRKVRAARRPAYRLALALICFLLGFSCNDRCLACTRIDGTPVPAEADDDDPEPMAEPSEEDGSPAARDSTLIEKVLEHDRQREIRVLGVSRVRLSHPQRLSGSLGAMVVRQPPDYDCATVCDFRGLLFQAEPGLAGGQLSVGYALVVGEKKHNEFFLSDVFVGFGIKGAVLRTWGDASLDPPDQTLIGAEADVTLTRVNFSLGAFRRITGDSLVGPWIVTGGVGWGF